MREKIRKYQNRIINSIALLFLPMLLLLAVTVGGRFEIFGNIAEESMPQEKVDQIVVGVSQLGSESGWRTANTESVQNAFTQKNGCFLIYHNARQKQENQLKAIRSFISQRVDYIVFSPVVETGWDTVLQEARIADIPVILMDRQVDVEDDSLYVTCVGSDFVEEGEKAGHWLETELVKRGSAGKIINIVMLLGTEGSSATIGRTAGFASVASKHKNWYIMEQADAEFTSTKGKEVMRGFLRRYDDIDVVISQNDDMTFGAIEAIQESGRSVGVNGDIIIVSFDAVKSALEMVEEGVINVDIECNPNQGEYLLRVIDDLEAGKAVEKQYYVEENIYTQENVTEELLRERSY
ncbi:MAG: ABC transporter substrate-binding protein [Lachnospiraceae bacterium]|nr:ABC transporter substrate-binding protein [Lachnospiraceae bacterium]